jgi:G3E family GTPase
MTVPTTPTVHVVVGLLGSGKTTLLQHLLAAPLPEGRPAVLVGELAELGFDGERLGDAAEVVEIAGAGPDAAARYARALRVLLDAGTRRVIVEASGAADAARLLAAFAADEVLRDDVTWGRTVTVVDAGAFEGLHAEFATALDAQIRLADVVVLNKTDRLRDRAALEAHVAAVNPAAEVVAAFMGQVRPAVVFAPRPGGRLPSVPADATASHLESFVYRSARRCFDRAHFGHALLNAPRAAGGRLARVKGVVRTWADTWTVSGVPGQLDWMPAPAERDIAVVFIGAGLRAAEPAIRAMLDAELDRQARG